MSKVLGGQMLQDVQTFVAALDTMFGGFRERADQTYALLKDPETAFVVVAAPERDALREASFFAGRLDEEGMPLAGLVVNRIQRVAAPIAERPRGPWPPPSSWPTSSRRRRPRRDRGAAAAARRPGGDGRPAGGGWRARFTAGHPGIPVVEVPAAAQDIHDLEGLRDVGSALTGG